MADLIQNVVIDFIVDDEALIPANDRLAKLGDTEKKNADEFSKANAKILEQIKVIDTLNKSNGNTETKAKSLKTALESIVGTVSKMGGEFKKQFAQGASDALAEAGVSAEEFEQALNGVDGAQDKVIESSKSLKTQLKEMVAQLAAMKVAGTDNSQEFTELAQKAGALKDAIGDANAEVDKFASDTSTFDGLISGVSGLAGGFAVVQGAAGLFGDESEELQKTLLKVNSAMAILQGLQQVQNVLQKESAAAVLANTIATRAQAIAQGALTVVVGTSTGALKLFRIALAATGVGLLVLGLIALYEALQDSNDELEKANKLIEEQGHIVENTTEVIKRRTEVYAAEADLAGASQSKVLAIRGQGLLKEREALVASQANLAAQRDALDATSEAWSVLNAEIEKNNDTIRGIDNQLVLANIAYLKQQADERKAAAEKAAADAKAAADKAREAAKKARAAAFEDYKAGIQLELLASEEGSEAQLQLRKDLLRAELQIALEAEGITLNQRRLLIQNFFKDQLELSKKFTADQANLFREAAISEANTALQQLDLSRGDRLLATEQVIKETASMEIAAAEGNAVKIREIAAKRDADIRNARLASLEATLQYEQDLEAAENGTDNRRLQAIKNDIEAEAAIRRDAVQEMAEIESSGVRKRIDLLNQERREGLISQEDYQLKYAQLVDQNRQIWEDAEKEKTSITEEESEKRKQKTIDDINTVVEVAQTIVGVLSSLYDAQSDREDQALDERKQKLADMVEAGAITEKEAITRTKRLEAEEKQVRQRQAQRDKQIAVFNALLAIPGAVLKGLAQGGPILAAIYGALAAVQAGIIASRKVPKFWRGKKDGYEGPGIVGEAGTELVEKGGRLFVASKESMVWLNKNDKVYNPAETQAMMSRRTLSVDRGILQRGSIGGAPVLKIDYKQIGEEVGKHLKTNVYVDGVQAQAIEKNSFEKYLNNRRTF